jgi:hypothetical protein
MKNTGYAFATGALLLCTLCGISVAKPLARISICQGSVSMLREGADDWRAVRPNMPLRRGDKIYTREESFVEIEYASGALLRMDEQTRVTITHLEEHDVKSESAIGNIWVNLKKIAKTKNEFEVASPTAVASIRGTVFQLATDEDSTTDVRVYNGKVAVGPSAGLKKRMDSTKKDAGVKEPVEVPGPSQVPPPHEVSLSAWMTIVAGQQISVDRHGNYATAKFDEDRLRAQDGFVARNKKLDAQRENE